MALRWNQNDTTLVLQKSWSEIERQTCIMGQIPALNISQIPGTGKLSMANDNHNIRNSPNKWHFRWGNSSEFKSENSKGSVYGGLHDTTQLNLNNEKLVCRRRYMWIQSVSFMLPQIYIYIYIIINKQSEERCWYHVW